MTDLWSEIVYIFQRMNWLSILDVFLVAAVVFAVLLLLRDTQIMILLRGVILIIILLVLLTTFINLPAFTWLVNTIMERSSRCSGATAWRNTRELVCA